MLNFVPKNNNLRDPRNDSLKSINSHYTAAKTTIGLNGFETMCLAYIQSLQNRYFEATHPQSTLTQHEISGIKKDYQELNNLVNKTLKSEIKRSASSEALIFDKPFAEANLSDGQKILLQFLCGLHAQKKSLNNCILKMDEPENHLHPSALIEFIEVLSNSTDNIQFWIATHSVPLLAYIAEKEPMSIWYVEGGSVTNAGRHPQKVLRGLLGDEKQIAALHSFTGLPAQFAATTFASESLLPPKTVEHNDNDPQTNQISELLKLSKSNSPIKLLDYGAGKGRLLSSFIYLAERDGKELKDSIDYLAFDPCDQDKETCESLLSECYGNEIRWFQSTDGFFETQDESSLDVVVMCNVLHEIPPAKWPAIFGSASLVHRALKDDGYVLIVEDQRIPIGEKAHQHGFLVLDTSHLRSLFKVTQEDMSNSLFKVDDYRSDGRLKAHLIAKPLISRITAETRKKAIKELKETSMSEIQRLRNEESNYKNGQLHGFWTQQFANASLYLDEI